MNTILLLDGFVYLCSYVFGRSDTEASINSEKRLKDEFREKLKRSQNCEEPLSQGLLHLPEQSHLTRVVSLTEEGAIELGNSGLMLNIITPLQKFSKGNYNLEDATTRLQY